MSDLELENTPSNRADLMVAAMRVSRTGKGTTLESFVPSLLRDLDRLEAALAAAKERAPSGPKEPE